MNLNNARELDVFLTRHNTIPANCVMHRRLCFEQWGYWPEDVAQAGDWRFWIRIIEGGGRANFAHCREPTCLHFVADWRRVQESGKYEARDLPRAKGWWPVVIQLEIPSGHTEQQVFFAEISAQGADWVERLRSRARDAGDRMAWAGMMELVPEMRARQAEVAWLGAEREQLVQRLANAEQTSERRYAQLKAKLERAVRRLANTREKERRRYEQLKAKLERAVRRLANAREKERRRYEQLKVVYASFSWRITRPLRAIKQIFFRWHGRWRAHQRVKRAMRNERWPSTV